MANKKISQLTPSSTNLQDVDEIEGQKIAGIESVKFTGAQIRAIEKAERETQDNVIEASVGLDVNGNFVPFSGTSFIDGATSIANAEELLDSALAGISSPYTAPGQIPISDALTQPSVIQASVFGTNGVMHLIQYEDETGLHTVWADDPTIDTINSVGLNVDGTLPPFSGTKHIDSATTIKEAVELLDSYSPLLFRQTANSSTVTGSTYTTLFGTGIGGLTVVSNSISVGDVFEIDVYGRTTTGATGTERSVKFTFGDFIELTDILPINLDHTHHYKIILTCRSVGVSGAFDVWFVENMNDTTSWDKNYFMGHGDSFVINTTISNTINLEVKWTTGGGLDNSFLTTQAIIKKL